MFMLNTDLYHESKRDLITNFKKWAMEVLSDAYDRQFSTNGLLADTWEEQRAITKHNHRPLMQAVHDTYAPRYENGVVPRKHFMDENVMLNTTSFGHHYRGMRDDASIEDLSKLSLAIGADITLHEMKISALNDREGIIATILNKYCSPTQIETNAPKQLERFM